MSKLITKFIFGLIKLIFSKRGIAAPAEQRTEAESDGLFLKTIGRGCDRLILPCQAMTGYSQEVT